MNQSNLSALIWSVAELLRGNYKQSDYGKVILPFTVLRRLDCVLEPTKAAVLAEHDAKTRSGINPHPFLLRASGTGFYNTSPLGLRTLLGDPSHVRANLEAYLRGFSPEVRDIFDHFQFATQQIGDGPDQRGKVALVHAKGVDP
jgi:type I restriction enzyme M protein